MKSSIANIFLASLCAAALSSTTAIRCEAQTGYSVLNVFHDEHAIAPEAGLVADAAGNLYGTTGSGSGNCYPFGCGTVFELVHETGGKYSFQLLHQFTGTDGQEPAASLILDSSGNLYGTTYQGGAHDGGVVFELSPSGSGWKETTLYNFNSFTGDLYYPAGPVAFDAAGNLWGATGAGGVGCSPNCGGVFELTNSGGQWTENIIYKFPGIFDGDGGPSSGVTWDSAGNLYGTMVSGGAVFELSKSADGTWTENSFGPAGYEPFGGVTLDPAGNMYGTTSRGGLSDCNDSPCGTVFELANQGNGSRSFNFVYEFDGTHGGWPAEGLTSDGSGNLYGIAPFGGANAQGVVFRLTKTNGTWTASTVHDFNLAGGALPVGKLYLSHRTLFGAARHGGNAKCNCGVVYSLKP